MGIALVPLERLRGENRWCDEAEREGGGRRESACGSEGREARDGRTQVIGGEQSHRTLHCCTVFVGPRCPARSTRRVCDPEPQRQRYGRERGWEQPHDSRGGA